MLIGGGSALTMAQLEDIQASCLADDIQIDFNRMSLWDECTVRAFFESGGEMVVAAVADTAAAAAPSTAAAAAAASTASAAVVAAAEPSGRALRWAVDISTWDPTPAQWTLLLGLLTEEESAKTMRFKFRDDQKRALVSRLLQRAACHEAYGLAHSAALIKRTKGG